jgi:hypothetical protein
MSGCVAAADAAPGQARRDVTNPSGYCSQLSATAPPGVCSATWCGYRATASLEHLARSGARADASHSDLLSSSCCLASKWSRRGVRHYNRRSRPAPGRGRCRVARDRDRGQHRCHSYDQGYADGYRSREPSVLQPQRAAIRDLGDRRHDRDSRSAGSPWTVPGPQGTAHRAAKVPEPFPGVLPTLVSTSDQLRPGARQP